MPKEKPKHKKLSSRKSPKNPTIKQRRVAEKMMENGGNISKAMSDSGYSKAFAKNPHKLTKSKGWQTIMDKYFSDATLGKKHSQLLEARHIQHYTFPATMDNKTIRQTILKGAPGSLVINIQRNAQWARAHFSVPDNGIQFKSLELGYKVKGRMKVEPEDPEAKQSEEIREVIFRIRKILPQAGQ